MKTKKKIAGILCAGALAGIAGMAGVYAWQSDRDDSRNTFIPGNIATAVEEEFTPQEADLDGSRPDHIKKTVRVKNTGRNECYVRVCAAFSNGDAGMSLAGVDTENWALDGGWYYYRHILDAGGRTTALFTGVDIAPDEEDMRFLRDTDELEVTVYEEAVPVRHGDRVFPSYREAWEFYTTNR